MHGAAQPTGRDPHLMEAVRAVQPHGDVLSDERVQLLGQIVDDDSACGRESREALPASRFRDLGCLLTGSTAVPSRPGSGSGSGSAREPPDQRRGRRRAPGPEPTELPVDSLLDQLIGAGGPDPQLGPGHCLGGGLIAFSGRSIGLGRRGEPTDRHPVDVDLDGHRLVPREPVGLAVDGHLGDRLQHRTAAGRPDQSAQLDRHRALRPAERSPPFVDGTRQPDGQVPAVGAGADLAADLHARVEQAAVGRVEVRRADAEPLRCSDLGPGRRRRDRLSAPSPRTARTSRRRRSAPAGRQARKSCRPPSSLVSPVREARRRMRRSTLDLPGEQLEPAGIRGRRGLRSGFDPGFDPGSIRVRARVLVAPSTGPVHAVITLRPRSRPPPDQ